jgi:hypothetical protein
MALILRMICKEPPQTEIKYHKVESKTELTMTVQLQEKGERLSNILIFFEILSKRKETERFKPISETERFKPKGVPNKQEKTRSTTHCNRKKWSQVGGGV